jgi:hypothetical protein
LFRQTFPKEILEVRKPLNVHIWNQSVSAATQYKKNLLEYFGNTQVIYQFKSFLIVARKTT